MTSWLLRGLVPALVLLTGDLFAAAQDRAPSTRGAADASIRPDDLCTIEGAVTNAATGSPVSNASVTAQSQDRSGTARAVTDLRGRYEIKGIRPGRYGMMAIAAGFLAVGSMQSSTIGGTGPVPGRFVDLAEGQRATGIDLKLMPYGAISGRVVNRDGEPIAGNYVGLARYKWDGGVRTLTDVFQAQCNDIGEYRISSAPPGRYILRVWRSDIRSQRDVDRSAKPRQEDYVTSYYPGVADPGAAVPLDLAPGQTLTGLNLTMVKARVSRVSGRVVNQTGSKPQSISVILSPVPMFAGQILGVVNAQGEFEFNPVPLGDYTLIAIVQAPPAATASTHQPITVGREPLENQVLTVRAPLQVSGSARVEGDAKVDFRPMSIELKLPWRDVGNFYGMGRIEEAGSFRIAGALNPERYVLSLRGLPPNFYVKSARYGPVDALTDGIDVSSGASMPLDVVLSPAAASVSGAVKDDADRIVEDATVVAVPQEQARQKQPIFYASAKTDQSGAFRLTGLAPGKYRIYAFARATGEPWASAAFLEPPAGRAKTVTLAERESQMTDVRLIAAEQ
jgi:hypothetical protein